MGTDTRLPQALAPALVACVVLAGLFLMHGLPGGDCAGHAGGGASSMMSASRMPASRTPVAIAHPLRALTSNPVGPTIEADQAATGVDDWAARYAVSRSVSMSAIDSSNTGAGMAAALCVSRPPQSDPAGVLTLLLVVGVLASGLMTGPIGLFGRFPRGGGLRAPPPAGSVLLVSLCISRT